jgi:hypothetical protein
LTVSGKKHVMLVSRYYEVIESLRCYLSRNRCGSVTFTFCMLVKITKWLLELEFSIKDILTDKAKQTPRLLVHKRTILTEQPLQPVK